MLLTRSSPASASDDNRAVSKVAMMLAVIDIMIFKPTRN